MNKKIFSVFILIMIITSSFVFADSNIDVKGKISDIKLLLNGERVDKEIVLIDGSSYLPVRAISESLGLDVEWEGSTQTIKLNTKEDSSSFDKEMLSIMEENNKSLKDEITVLKDLLIKNNIKVPTKDSVVAYLGDTINLLSRKDKSYSMDIATAYKSENTFTDSLGNKYSSYIVLDIFRSFNSGSGETYITYPSQGQYDKFKATVAPLNRYGKTFKHQLVVYADDKEVHRMDVSSESFLQDIEVDIRGSKTVKFVFEASDGSNLGGIILGEPRFTIN